MTEQISIHAPRAGRDCNGPCKDALDKLFQSTRPVRGATEESMRSQYSHHNFNPRAPCGARPIGADTVPVSLSFQSTRPVRGATEVPFRALGIFLFQSTRPVRGATVLHRAGGH